MRSSGRWNRNIHADIVLHFPLNASASEQHAARFQPRADFPSVYLSLIGLSRPWTLQTIAGALRLCVMECKPVVPSPAKHAPYRPQGKHAQQAVERPQLGLFELQ
jgi:hypothetical protein